MFIFRFLNVIILPFPVARPNGKSFFTDHEVSSSISGPPWAFFSGGESFQVYKDWMLLYFCVFVHVRSSMSENILLILLTTDQGRPFHCVSVHICGSAVHGAMGCRQKKALS